MTAFIYPGSFTRRHGPQGYDDYASYRPWLRDEFTFRCVYCLRRERWLGAGNLFAIDHFKPVALHPNLDTKYDNLLYACATCNPRKGDVLIPDPTIFFIQTVVTIDSEGVIQATTPQAKKIIRVLDLSGPEDTRFRKLWLATLRVLQEHDPTLYAEFMGFPDDLPDLTRLLPTKNNEPTGY